MMNTPNSHQSIATTLKLLQGGLRKGQPLGDVLRQLKPLAQGLPDARERLEGIGETYRMMACYLLEGVSDSHRAVLYDQLAHSAYRLISDLRLDLKLHHDARLATLAPSASQTDLNAADIRSQLESFVSESTLLSLEPEATRADRERDLNERHQRFLNETFLQIVASRQWSKDLGQDMEALLLAPTIDAADAQLFASAIMMGTMLMPDPGKVLTLIHVYTRATDEKLRQRALTGWVFALDADDMAFFPSVAEAVGEVLKDDAVQAEIVQLQMQTVYCMNAERDNEKIRKDVMPTILENQNFEITRFGIREKVEDPMQDILHPDADEEKMEHLEQSLSKLSEMQKQGVDVYFGGFSKMKRFDFFRTLSNWFQPFYLSHPQLRRLREALPNEGLLSALFQNSPLCDSDKYSFALGLATVVNQLPPNIKEMLLHGEGAAIAWPEGTESQNSPAFIRRLYLQDLFRFYRLNDMSQAFANPFSETGSHLLLNNARFLPLLKANAGRIERFLLKHRMYAELEALLPRYFDSSNPRHLLTKAHLELHHQHYAEAEGLLAQAIKLSPDDEVVQKAYAMAAFYAGDYAVAVGEYRQLLRRHPEEEHYKLNCAIALINGSHEAEGVDMLYELNYNHPDDMNVSRALAWGLMCTGKLQQAERLYTQILQSAHPTATDDLNAGYCAWISGQPKEALQRFAGFLGKPRQEPAKGDALMEKFLADMPLLQKHGITQVDCRIMASMAQAKHLETQAS